ncbi:thiamine pyrophosphokinase [Pedobacter xixiisoli]|uniref:Thiamine pyrophosphokinase n=1 Tax=Pedobacter xixiisoli TaxID=1476464 RepID=A0A286ACL1_9SPHI|nr:thiamine pyrophosphokinase [Pedobacter xixiisoli]SOD19640.1 thiamine pyrophosphokinase [Pedobacter xixiisoli]
MSSHHIVKEKQEPALYIHEFANFDEEHLGQLLEWSPTVIVAASEYEKVVSLGLKVDVIIGNLEAGAALQENIRIIPQQKKGIEDAMEFLVKEKYPAVNVISKMNSFDDLTCYLPDLNLVLFTERTKHYAIKDGFSVWKPAGTIFLIDIIAYFEADNLMQQETSEFVVVEDGMVNFRFKAPYLFLGELL